MAYPEWNQTANSKTSFGHKARAVTPSDSVNLDPVAKAVVVTDITGGSNLSIETVDGDTVLFVGVSVGFVVPYVVSRVNDTGTDCTTYTID